MGMKRGLAAREQVDHEQIVVLDYKTGSYSRLDRGT